MKKRYYIDIESNKMYDNEELFSSEKLADNICTSISFIKEIISKKNCLAFISDYRAKKYVLLNKVDINIILKDWDIKFSQNISFEKEDGAILGDFPNSYFYFVDCWKSIEGKMIFIFNMNH